MVAEVRKVPIVRVVDDLVDLWDRIAITKVFFKGISAAHYRYLIWKPHTPKTVIASSTSKEVRNCCASFLQLSERDFSKFSPGGDRRNGRDADMDSNSNEIMVDHESRITSHIGVDNFSDEDLNGSSLNSSGSSHYRAFWDVFRRKDVPMLIEYLRFNWKKHGDSDHLTDDSVGVCAAFHAPVVVLLFALEEVATWWRNALIWRTSFITVVVLVVQGLHGILVNLIDPNPYLKSRFLRTLSIGEVCLTLDLSWNNISTERLGKETLCSGGISGYPMVLFIPNMYNLLSQKIQRAPIRETYCHLFAAGEMVKWTRRWISRPLGIDFSSNNIIHIAVK
ncbi:hypothetical protein FXO38_27530 [Capsicum annuum]|nr:hypothetical protein FXO38_27530 [Capsicum annuum]